MHQLCYLIPALCALALVSCSRQEPEEATAPSALPLAYVRGINLPDSLVFKDVGITAQCFEAKGLKGHQITIWTEVYIDGKFDEEMSEGSSFTPAMGEFVGVQSLFTLQYHSPPGQNAYFDDGQTKWSIAFFGSTMGLGDTMRDRLDKQTLIKSTNTNQVNLVPGKDVTVWKFGAATPDSKTLRGITDEEVESSHFAILVKCRMDLLPPDKRHETVHSSYAFTPTPSRTYLPSGPGNTDNPQP